MTRKHTKAPAKTKRGKRKQRKRGSVTKPQLRTAHAAKKSPVELDREITQAISLWRSRRQHSVLAEGFAAIPGVAVE